jgi:hypothetical protein
MLARLMCYWVDRHEPVRQLLGGFRCVRCGKAARDLEELVSFERLSSSWGRSS